MIKVHNRLVELARERGVAGGRGLRDGAARDHLALPVGDRQRLPPAAGRRRAGRLRSSSTARASTAPTARRGSRSSSRMPRSGTATARSATPSSSTRARGALRLFPDLIGFRPGARRARHRLEQALRRAGRAAGAAGEADRRPPRSLADRASGGDHRRGRARRLPIARRPRPRAGTRLRPALGRGRGAGDGRGAARRRPAGPARRRLGGRDAAVALLPGRVGRAAAAASSSARAAAGSSPRS